jgi:hypothetical protein
MGTSLGRGVLRKPIAISFANVTDEYDGCVTPPDIYLETLVRSENGIYKLPEFSIEPQCAAVMNAVDETGVALQALPFP